MLKSWTCGFFLLSTPTALAAPCDELSPDLKPLLCADTATSTAYDKMDEAFKALTARLPPFAVASLKDEMGDYLQVHARSCKTSGTPEQIRTCATMRLNERTMLLQERLARPVDIGQPTVPTKPFGEVCTAQRKPADKANLAELKKFLRASDCVALEAVLAELTVFTAFGREHSEPFPTKMSSLALFAYAPKLRAVELPYGSPVTDLSPLAHLTLLTTVLADGSKIKDVAALSGLKLLERVGIRTTGVTDIRPLLGLTRLNDLDLRHLKLPAAQVQELKKLHAKATVNLD